MVEARCLVTLDDSGQYPIGIVFLDDQEFDGLEQRTAKLLYVEGSTFKARDSKRNEFQIQALNETEAATIRELKRGMQVVISLADNYVVRFVVLGASDSSHFVSRVAEQLLIFSLGRNPLADPVTGEAGQQQVESTP